MNLMANPMDALNEIQQALNQGMRFNFLNVATGYQAWNKKFNNGETYSFAKIINNEIQALAIFGLEAPYRGVESWSVGYAVSQSYRRRGLATEAINVGTSELKNILRVKGLSSFNLEALIDADNIPSIKLAGKLFSCIGEKTVDGESGRPALFFSKIIPIG